MSRNCRDLLGGDLSTPEGRQAAKDENLYAVCPGIVTDAAKTLPELLHAGRHFTSVIRKSSNRIQCSTSAGPL